MTRLSGLAVAALAALAAWGVSTAVPAVPLLTAAVVLGIVVGQLPAARPALAGPLKPGLALSARRLMRIGIVLLGLKLSLGDIADLGVRAILLVVAVVLLSFAGTYAIARLFGMPGRQPLLIATGFSICGASAIGAMSGVTRGRDSESATPIALVTLCGTLAILVLPLLQVVLGLSPVEFGHWVGAGVHDVGQVVATAQVAGPAALGVAIAIKLTRVLMLAPMVAAVSVLARRSEARDPAAVPAALPPVIPLFVAGFLAAIAIRTLLPVPESVLTAADAAQTALLAMALFALGAAVRLRDLFGAGGRAIAVGLLSWLLVAALALGAVRLS
ncbi:YeiH family protein [Planctomonas psychrotolerans]|uniref:YeiH family protein n=1 Tax=Planctomonas psychrotolerans TaxID=2528712 RepID=UPI00123B9C82|nr:putative sulfate exporter family transporter [Planctomonas psychrotolerans]